MIVRSLHFGFEVPDTDAATATLFYPGDEATLADARLTGIVAAGRGQRAWPLVVIMPGVNVVPHTYAWLAQRLVEAGHCVLTYQTIGSLGPAGRGITPGIDMAALAPGVLGTRCSAPALGPLLSAVADLGGPVEDAIDLTQVVVGGHSAGGTMALHNSTPEWVPGLRGVFSFGGHTMISTALGHGEATVSQVPSAVPVLLVTGASDGVIAASRDRYRDTDELADHDPVERTFHEGITRNLDDSWFVELTNGNHFTICDPIDETSGRSFLEAELRQDDSTTREVLARLIAGFVDRVCDVSDNDDVLQEIVSSDAVSRWHTR